VKNEKLVIEKHSQWRAILSEQDGNIPHGVWSIGTTKNGFACKAR